MHVGGHSYSLSHYYNFKAARVIVLLAITIMNFNCSSVAVNQAADTLKVDP